MTAARRPWSLRRRLVAGLVLVLALLSGVVGTASIAILHQDLMTRLDERLDQTARKRESMLGEQSATAPPPGTAGAAGGASPPPAIGPGPRAGGLVVVETSGGVQVAAFVDDSGAAVDLAPDVVDAIRSGVAVEAPPVTLDLGGDLGPTRLVAHLDPVTGAVVWSGLSTAEVATTISRLVAIYLVVAITALVAAGIVGAGFVGRSLRPLEAVAGTARRVAERDLAEGEVDLPERVPEADTDPRTEVGQVGAALNGLIDRVEQALGARHRSEQQLRRFVADASHELRTPLASVRGYTELARREPERLSETQSHSLERIDAESARMTSLVEDLLLLARLDAGQPLRHEPVDVVRLVVESVSDAQAADRSHVWRLEAHDEELSVTGDADRLRQVLGNLLANARHHTPKGTVVTASVDRDGDDVRVRVADDGPGIDPELLPDVFGRFVRGEGSRARRGAAVGLGLSISEAIVASHGGTVDVSSVPGRTVFTVRLPARDAAAARDDARHQTKRNTYQPPPSGSSVTIPSAPGSGGGGGEAPGSTNA